MIEPQNKAEFKEEKVVLWNQKINLDELFLNFYTTYNIKYNYHLTLTIPPHKIVTNDHYIEKFLTHLTNTNYFCVPEKKPRLHYHIAVEQITLSKTELKNIWAATLSVDHVIISCKKIKSSTSTIKYITKQLSDEDKEDEDDKEDEPHMPFYSSIPYNTVLTDYQLYIENNFYVLNLKSKYAISTKLYNNYKKNYFNNFVKNLKLSFKDKRQNLKLYFKLESAQEYIINDPAFYKKKLLKLSKKTILKLFDLLINIIFIQKQSYHTSSIQFSNLSTKIITILDLQRETPLLKLNISKKIIELFLTTTNNSSEIEYEYLYNQYCIPKLTIQPTSKTDPSYYCLIKYPLLTKPADWKNLHSATLTNNYTGGYLLNSSTKIHPLQINSSTSNKSTILLKSDLLLSSINKLQTNSFNFNYNFITYLKDNYLPTLQLSLTQCFEELKPHYVKYRGRKSNFSFQNYLSLIKKALTNNDEKLKAKLFENETTQQLYFKYLTFNTKYNDLNLTITNIQNFSSFNLNLPFYFTYQIDFRSRIYCHSHLNFTSSQYVRAALTACGHSVFNFDEFKNYISKLYDNKKRSFNESVSFFESTIAHEITLNYNSSTKILNFDYWISRSEPIYFLAAALEYIKFKNHRSTTKKYKSNFLISIDATSSGNQIIALMLNDDRYKGLLNLVSGDLNYIPKSFYQEILNQFLAKTDLQNYFTEGWITGKVDEVTLKSQLLKILSKSMIMKISYNATNHTLVQDFNLAITQINNSQDNYKINLRLETVSKLVRQYREFLNNLSLFKILSILTSYAALFKHFNKHIEWETPAEIKILFNPVKSKKVQTKLLLTIADENDTIKRLVKNIVLYHIYENLINSKKLTTGITANLIHSYDASIIYNFIRLVDKNLIYFFIHDQINTTTAHIDEVRTVLSKVMKEIFDQTKVINTILDSFDNRLRTLTSELSSEKQQPIYDEIDKNRLKANTILLTIEKDNELLKNNTKINLGTLIESNYKNAWS